MRGSPRLFSLRPRGKRSWLQKLAVQGGVTPRRLFYLMLREKVVIWELRGVSTLQWASTLMAKLEKFCVLPKRVFQGLEMEMEKKRIVESETSMWWGSLSFLWPHTVLPIHKIQSSHPSKCVDQWELLSSSSYISGGQKNCKSSRSWQVEIETLKTERLQSISAIFVKKHFFYICQKINSSISVNTHFSISEYIFSSTASKQTGMSCLVNLVHSFGPTWCTAQFNMCTLAFALLVQILYNLCKICLNSFCALFAKFVQSIHSVWSAVYAADVWSDDLLGIEEHVWLVPYMSLTCSAQLFFVFLQIIFLVFVLILLEYLLRTKEHVRGAIYVTDLLRTTLQQMFLHFLLHLDLALI